MNHIESNVSKYQIRDLFWFLDVYYDGGKAKKTLEELEHIACDLDKSGKQKDKAWLGELLRDK